MHRVHLCCLAGPHPKCQALRRAMRRPTPLLPMPDGPCHFARARSPYPSCCLVHRCAWPLHQLLPPMRIVCGLGQASCLCPGVHLAGPSERHKRHVHLALASRDHGQSCRDDKEFHAEGADQKEAGVVEEVTAGWYVYDSTTKVWSEQAGVRVVRYAAAVVYRTSSTESTRSPKASQELKSADENIRKKHVKTSHHTVGNHNFQKMDVCSHRNIVSSHHQHLITPTKICSHHQFTKSHRHNFVHTMQMLITLLKLLFTPSKFCSHHQFSNRHNFDHTIKMLITLLKSCFTPSKF